VRALATDPKLLLLDEITSALDPVLVGEVLDVVRDLKENGSTILMATHEMGFARRVADRVVFLSDGRVVEQGPPQQLFDDPQRQETRDFLARLHH
jgi:ABC-type polar amino acid transport system ATPase subunit